MRALYEFLLGAEPVLVGRSQGLAPLPHLVCQLLNLFALFI